jgi:hypothetical protein
LLLITTNVWLRNGRLGIFTYPSNHKTISSTTIISIITISDIYIAYITLSLKIAAKV